MLHFHTSIFTACTAVLLGGMVCGPTLAAPDSPVPTPIVRVAPAPVTVAAAPAAPDEYTGVLIDARALPDILRSPSPAIYGPAPAWSLLYPDRSHVPTPDEVQDESVVRYYRTDEEAARGVGGAHPFVVKAVAVVGPAKDSLTVSADDMQKLMDVEKSLHFTQTWRVGFLVPGDK